MVLYDLSDDVPTPVGYVYTLVQGLKWKCTEMVFIVEKESRPTFISKLISPEMNGEGEVRRGRPERENRAPVTHTSSDHGILRFSNILGPSCLL